MFFPQRAFQVTSRCASIMKLLSKSRHWCMCETTVHEKLGKWIDVLDEPRLHRALRAQKKHEQRRISRPVMNCRKPFRQRVIPADFKLSCLVSCTTMCVALTSRSFDAFAHEEVALACAESLKPHVPPSCHGALGRLLISCVYELGRNRRADIPGCFLYPVRCHAIQQCGPFMETTAAHGSCLVSVMSLHVGSR